MKVILILVLFAYELSIAGCRIRILKMNTEYKVDLLEYPDKKIPSKTNNYFKTVVRGNQRIEILLKTLHISTPSAYFKVDICPFSKSPNIDEVFAVNKSCYIDAPFSVKKQGLYDIYKFHYDIIDGINFLSIHIENLYTLDYLSVLCNQISLPKYKLYDISYMEEYKINTTSLYDNEIYLIFRMENLGNIGSIKIKVSNELLSEIELDIGGYRKKPIMTGELDDYIDLYALEIKSLTKDGNYSIYEFPYIKIDGAGYLALMIYLEKKVNYFSIYVGP